MRNGHGFYTFVRIYICGLAAVLALQDWRRGMAWLPLSAAAIAILFNPVRPIEMRPADWFWFDLGAALWMIAVAAWPALRRMGHDALQSVWIGAAFFTIVGLAIAVAMTRSAVPNNIMNVDEDLTNTDMNAATGLAEGDAIAVKDPYADITVAPDHDEADSADQP
jgi:hypothetical protein